MGKACHGKPGFGQQPPEMNNATAIPIGQTQFDKPPAAGIQQAPSFTEGNSSVSGSTPKISGLFDPNAPIGFGVPATTQQPASNISLFGTTQPNTRPSSASDYGTSKQSSFVFGQASTTTTVQTGGFGQNITNDGTGFGFGTGNQSLFGNNANEPGGVFENTGQTANTASFGTYNTFGNNLSNFGTPNLRPFSSISSTLQQIWAFPYGYSPVLEDHTDALGSTNPAAHRAILESNQFKISPNRASRIKVKQDRYRLKKELFDSLEAYDRSEESFSIIPIRKNLIIKPKANTSSSSILHTSRKRSILNISSDQTSNSNNNSPNDPGNSAQQCANRHEESFKNQIPSITSPTDIEDVIRREWQLRPIIPDKINEGNELSESVMDDTLSELLPDIQNELKPSENVITANRKNKYFSEISISQKSSNYIGQRSNDSLSSSSNPDIPLINSEPHPTGIILRRAGYYTIPSLDDLVFFLNDDGTCIVPNFAIGREGYGNVFFNESFDVAGMNLDELVHFRHKEVIIYLDDENKPPIGTGLNRKAQITLDQVWPHDKILRQPITDIDRLKAMNYEGKLRSVCDKHDTHFLEYRPETGSWVFRVNNFSKYGLSDTEADDDDDDDLIQRN